MNDLEGSVDRIASETALSGVVRVDRGDDIELVKGYGFAHRGWEIPNEVDTQFAIASGTKGLTALTVMSLIEEGTLGLATNARSVLGTDLPLIDDRVTVEQLLAHRSSIGDYYDEEIERDPTDHVSPVSVYELGSTEDYLRVLGGFETKFAPPDERFLQQRRLRGARADRGARLRDTVPRAGRAARVRTRRDGGHGVPALGRAPGPRGTRVSHGGRTEDECLPSAGPRERGRRHLHHGSGYQRLVDRPLRRRHRVDGSGRRDGAPPQRGAVTDAVSAVRPGDLAPPLGRPGGAARVGRRRVLPDHPRFGPALHLHGPVEHDRGAWPVVEQLDALVAW